MSKELRTLNITPKIVAIDLVLTVIVWYLFKLWFGGHVPSYDEGTVGWVAAVSALPAAGTFWLCLQMFRVTLVHQRKLKQERGK